MNEASQTVPIRSEFAVHILNGPGIAKARELAYLFTAFLNDLESVCGVDGREMSIVRTKLEEASFFAKKAMASRPENQSDAP
jgi:hypothetical protein